MRLGGEPRWLPLVGAKPRGVSPLPSGLRRRGGQKRQSMETLSSLLCRAHGRPRLSKEVELAGSTKLSGDVEVSSDAVMRGAPLPPLSLVPTIASIWLSIASRARTPSLATSIVATCKRLMCEI